MTGNRRFTGRAAEGLPAGCSAWLRSHPDFQPAAGFHDGDDGGGLRLSLGAAHVQPVLTPGRYRTHGVLPRKSPAMPPEMERRETRLLDPISLLLRRRSQRRVTPTFGPSNRGSASAVLSDNGLETPETSSTPSRHNLSGCGVQRPQAGHQRKLKTGKSLSHRCPTAH
jgi:hypothetical protein